MRISFISGLYILNLLGIIIKLGSSFQELTDRTAWGLTKQQCEWIKYKLDSVTV